LEFPDEQHLLVAVEPAVAVVVVVVLLALVLKPELTRLTTESMADGIMVLRESISVDMVVLLLRHSSNTLTMTWITRVFFDSPDAELAEVIVSTLSMTQQMAGTKSSRTVNFDSSSATSGLTRALREAGSTEAGVNVEEDDDEAVVAVGVVSAISSILLLSK
jgi:hypothetical protein